MGVWYLWDIRAKGRNDVRITVKDRDTHHYLPQLEAAQITACHETSVSTKSNIFGPVEQKIVVCSLFFWGWSCFEFIALPWRSGLRGQRWCGCLVESVPPIANQVFRSFISYLWVYSALPELFGFIHKRHLMHQIKYFWSVNTETLRALLGLEWIP